MRAAANAAILAVRDMWALDLGTTNTVLARWDGQADRPAVLELPAISRRPAHADAAEVARGVPSAVHVLDRHGFWARLGRTRPLARTFFLGKLAHIGRPALELNQLRQRSNFVPSFKRALGRSPLMTVARAGGRGYSAREVAWLFLRELLAEAKETCGERIRELTITSPVEAFETYRAEVAGIARSLGVKRVQFVDEPVAAAAGYGLGLATDRRALVVDFGGGTFHVALVQLSPKAARAGQCEVLAKAGREVGGNLVDRWLLEELCGRLHHQLAWDTADEDERLWHGLMLAEACRVKEAVYFADHTLFELPAPEDFRRFEARLRGERTSLEIRREDLTDVLTRRGLYRTLESCLDEVLAAARERGVGEEQIQDVLMVGGSTLLSNVYALFEQRFGRARVRAWQPFDAVAYGGAVFAAGRVGPADFIVHDYALLTYDLRSKRPEYTVIVPRGTRFPTPPDLWKRQLVPTCSLGEPERVFKLVVCEVGADDAGNRLAWDASGRPHQLREGDAQVVVKLNEANPALGYLDPPHSPQDQRPRLEISFGINDDRWLCATVLDLRTKKHLMRAEPVVRLL